VPGSERRKNSIAAAGIDAKKAEGILQPVKVELLAEEDFLYVRVGDLGYGLVSASKSIADSVHDPPSRRT
jgi:hypothetical protein